MQKSHNDQKGHKDCLLLFFVVCAFSPLILSSLTHQCGSQKTDMIGVWGIIAINHKHNEMLSLTTYYTNHKYKEFMTTVIASSGECVKQYCKSSILWLIFCSILSLQRCILFTFNRQPWKPPTQLFVKVDKQTRKSSKGVFFFLFQRILKMEGT